MKKKKKEVNPKWYVDNDKLVEALIVHRKKYLEAMEAEEPKPKLTNYIADCILKICDKYSYYHKFINYTYREDMVLDAIENCFKYAHNFKIEKSPYAHAYFTKIAFYAFINRINKEQMEFDIRAKYVRNNGFMNDLSSEMLENNEYDDNSVVMTTIRDYYDAEPREERLARNEIKKLEKKKLKAEKLLNKNK